MALACDKIQGSFTADGKNKRIVVPIGLDTFETWNLTKMAAAAPTGSVYCRWQRGFDDWSGIVYTKAGSSALSGAVGSTSGGTPQFLLYDYGTQSLGNPVAVSSVSDSATFTVTATVAADTNPLQDGDVVQLYNIATNTNSKGFPFEVDNVNHGAGTFTIKYALANTLGGAGGAGQYRIIYAAAQQWYPQYRYILNVSQAAQAVVRCSVTHGYKVGQTVKFNISSPWGMTQLNGVSATIVDVDTAANTFTIDHNTLSYSAFTWISIANAASAYSFATVAPAYMDTAEANNQGVDPFSDARRNEMTKGMILATGAYGPAGESGDSIYWQATSSTYVDNS